MSRDKKSYDNMLGNAYAQVAISTMVRPEIHAPHFGTCSESSQSSGHLKAKPLVFAALQAAGNAVWRCRQAACVCRCRKMPA